MEKLKGNKIMVVVGLLVLLVGTLSYAGAIKKGLASGVLHVVLGRSSYTLFNFTVDANANPIGFVLAIGYYLSLIAFFTWAGISMIRYGFKSR